MFQIAGKDIRIFFSDTKAVLLTFILPIALVTLFALAFGGTGKSYKPGPTLLPVADLDSSNISLYILAELDSINGIEIERSTVEEAKQKVREGKRKALLVLYKGFQDSINAGTNPAMEMFYDQAREMEIGILQQALFSRLMSLVGKGIVKHNIMHSIKSKYKDMDTSIINIISRQVDNQISSQNDHDKSPANQSGLKMTKIFRNKKNSPGLIQAVAGVAVMMLLFSVSAMGSTILAEKEEGTLKRLLCSPMNPVSIISGKMIYALFIAILQLVILFIFAALVFRLNILIDLPSLIVMILTTAFACSSFGLFLAAICKSRKQVESLSVIVILIMSAIGGSMMPIFIMPEFMQKIAVFSVNYWSINGFF